MDEERWPRQVTDMSVLNTEGLLEVHLVFKRLTALVAEGIVRWVRNEETFEYKQMNVKKI
jgi:hypothetical protein